MNSAIKAAIISFALVVLLVAGYFLFVDTGPRAPVADPGGADQPAAGGEIDQPPELPGTAMDPVREQEKVAVRVKVVDKETTRTLVRSKLRVLEQQEAESSGTLVADLPDNPRASGGTFEVRLAPGRYTLNALCPGYTSASETVTVIQGREVDPVTFELGRGNTISGRVLTSSGEPIAGAEVAALEDLGDPDADIEDTLILLVDLEKKIGDHVHAKTTSGPDGYYEIGGLERTWYTVRAVAKGFSPRERKAVLAPATNVDLSLQEGSVLSGNVVDGGNGAAVAGARVRAYPELENAGLFDVILAKSRPAVGEVLTDSAGQFQLDQLGTGLYNFAVSAPGYQERTLMKVRVSPGPNEPLAFKLDPGAIVRGIVRDPDDAPLAGAKVKLTQVGGVASQRDRVYVSFDDGSVETDQDGVFLFDTLKSGKFMLVVWHRDYQSVQRKDVSPSEEELVIKLSHGGQLEGRIVDGNSGDPVIGATVTINDVSSYRKDALTDENGEYFLGGLNSSRKRLTVHVKAPGYSRDKREVRVPSGRKLREDFELRRTGTVEGRVLLSSGDPVVGARVEVRRYQTGTGTPQRVGSDSTDSDGRFEILDVEPDENLVVRVKQPGYLDAYSELFSLDSDEVVSINNMRLDLGGEIAGQVTTKDGRPIQGCMVTARPPGDTEISSSESRTVNTDAKGSYLIRGLQSGRVALIFKATNFVEKEVRDVEVEEGHRNVGQNVVLETAGIVEGRVINTDGDPVVGAEIVAQDTADGLQERRTVSDPGGNFRLANIAAKGKIVVEVQHAEYDSWLGEEVEVGERELQVVLEPLGRVRGVVVDPRGQPVTSFSVQPQPTAAQPGVRARLRSRTVTNAEGLFEYGGVPDGVYDVYVRSPRFAATKVPGVEVRKGEVADLGEIALDEGGRVTGRVLASGDGSAVSGARVRIVQGLSRFMDRRSPDAKPVQVTGADGRFEFNGLKSGTLTLEVKHTDFVVERITGVDPQNVETSRDLVVELDVGAEVVGFVSDATGAAQRGMQVYLMSQGGSSRDNRTAHTDNDGNFYFRGVAPGDYIVKAHKFPAAGSGQRPRMAEATVRVTQGARQEVVLQVEER